MTRIGYRLGLAVLILGLALSLASDGTLAASDWGDDAPEIYGPFATYDEASGWSDTLVGNLSAQDDSVPWSDYVYVSAVLDPESG